MSPERDFKVSEMRVKTFGTRKEMGYNAAEDVARKIRQLTEQKEEVNIIFAAAPSQNEFLERLVQIENVEWNKVNAFHMDEYIGLKFLSEQSFGYYLNENIFSRVGFKSVNYLNGNAEDLHRECLRYEKLLKEHKPDIVCMGIGENGHIAFNDPHVANFNDPKMVKKVELDEICRQQQVNDGCFKDIRSVPACALTLTIPTLMEADYIFCVVPSKSKAVAVYNTICGEVSEKCPASILKQHKDTVLYCDAESAVLFLAGI